jgi:hypothetical protein
VANVATGADGAARRRMKPTVAGSGTPPVLTAGPANVGVIPRVNQIARGRIALTSHPGHTAPFGRPCNREPHLSICHEVIEYWNHVDIAEARPCSYHLITHRESRVTLGAGCPVGLHVDGGLRRYVLPGESERAKRQDLPVR